MRCGTVVAGLVLLLLSALPFVLVSILEDSQKERRPLDPRREPGAHVRRGPPGPLPPDSSQVPTAAPDPAGDLVTTGAEPAPGKLSLTFVGALRLPGSRSAIHHRLSLRSKAGERDVFTNEVGEFSFLVAEGHLPIALSDSGGTPLYTYRSIRDPLPIYLNLELLRPTRRFKGLIQPKSVSASRFKDGTHRVRVRGDTALEAGQSLFAYLFSSTKVVSSGLHYRSDDGVLADMLIPTSGLHSGRFKFTVAWKPSSAQTSAVEKVRRFVQAADVAALPPELDARGFVYIGSPKEEAAQQEEILDYCRKALSEVQCGRDLILAVAWEVRARGVAETPDEKDEWYQELALLENSRRRQALSKYPPLRENSSSWRKGALSLKKWRKLIDETLPERWRRFRDPANFPYPEKYPDIAVRLPDLFAELARLTRFESRLIYEAMGESPSERDYVDASFGPWDERRLSVGRLNRVSKELIQQLGL